MRVCLSGGPRGAASAALWHPWPLVVLARAFGRASRRYGDVLDVLYIGLTVAFFALAAAYVRGCERL
jgi:hypothetical protein